MANLKRLWQRLSQFFQVRKYKDCPHCGATIRYRRSICPACGKYLTGA